MTTWEQTWPDARPRWGTYSVKAHQRLDRIIADLLTNDVLVFPCPEDDAEFDRWEGAGWDPQLLAHRVTQLGDHAVVTPWDSALREGWRQNWWGTAAKDRADPEAPFTLTAAMMADLPLVRLMGEQDDRFGATVLERPKVASAFAGHEGSPRAEGEPLELVALFQAQRDVSALTGFAGAPSVSGLPKYGADADGIRLRLQLATPVESDDSTLFRPSTSSRTRTSSTPDTGCGRGKARCPRTPIRARSARGCRPLWRTTTPRCAVNTPKLGRRGYSSSCQCWSGQGCMPSWEEWLAWARTSGPPWFSTRLRRGSQRLGPVPRGRATIRVAPSLGCWLSQGRPWLRAPDAR